MSAARRILSIALLVLMTAAGAALAEEPLETIKGPLEESLSLLKDPAYQDPSRKQEQRDLMWKLIESVFDFEEVSRRALARNWNQFDDGQKSEFVSLFTRLLGNTYLNQVQEAYKDETVAYDSQEIHESKPLARVQTRILSQKGDIPVDYSLKKVDGRWRIYDVKVEGVSLVKNYRTQFEEILMKESPGQLIERLKAKVVEQESSPAGA
ncbi:MAG: MlaC/ttg2D family ABC transporter substrate-binding protein [Desulfobacterales bacterium]